MISFLSKIFIKNNTDYKAPATRQAYGVLCGCVGIALNILLFIGKFIAGTISGSIAITADAFNNLSDAGSSFITMIGFKLAGQKPDPDHPFGHGRIEYISGMIVSFAILLMGVELIKSSFDKILHPEDTQGGLLIMIILIVSILVKLYMSYYNHSIGKKIDSVSMLATATDSSSDTISTLLVLISVIITKYTGLHVDGYFGLLVGLFIFYSGVSAAKDTINPLLGQAPDKEFVDQIEQIVMSHDLILGIHDLVVHNYGPGRVMISLHAEVPANGDLLTMHDQIDHIEHELNTTLGCESVIHMDPIMNDNEDVQALKKKISKILYSIDPDLQFHDFRAVFGPTHTNIIFDLVVPYKYGMSDDEVKDLVFHKINEYNSTYFAVIDVDHAYV